MKTSIFIALPAVCMLWAFTQGIKKRPIDLAKSSVSWTGKKFTGEHRGNVNLKSGYLTTQNGLLSGGAFEIDMRTITNTDIPDEPYRQKLITSLKSPEFFSVEKYPTASFVITKTRVLNGNKYQIDGRLTVKGITGTLSFPAEVFITGEKIKAKARVSVDRTRYNIRFKSSSFFDSLGDSFIYDDFEIGILLRTN